MSESPVDVRFRARIIVALAVMTIACLLMATALLLLAQGAVARDMAVAA
jgi:hypothetical protein